MPSLDILAFGSHPDDVELGCCGTLLKHLRKGGTAGIIDLTRGELGTRGDAGTRTKESESAKQILGINVRENLELEDGFFRADKKSLLKVVQVIRKYRPGIILANAVFDRHPDHGRGSRLVAEAAFLSGLKKIETELDGKAQEAWRPSSLYHYVQDYYMRPDVVVDVTEVWEEKMKAIQAFSSQFYTGREDDQPETPISTKGFLEGIVARARDMGRPVGVEYGEGFVVERAVGVADISDLI